MQLSHEDIKVICESATNIVLAICICIGCIYFIKKQFD